MQVKALAFSDCYSPRALNFDPTIDPTSELLGISRNTLRAKLRLRDAGAEELPRDANG